MDDLKKVEERLRELIGINEFRDEYVLGRDVEELSKDEYVNIVSLGCVYSLSVFNLGYAHIHTFSEFMVRRFGEKIRPWLKVFYQIAVHMPEYSFLKTSSLAEVEAFDVYHFDDNLKPWLCQDKEFEDVSSELMSELKMAAWTIVRENPGIDRSEWIDKLIRQYPSEVVDAYGTNPPEVYHELADLWEMEYTDPETGEWNSFAGWSEYFATDPEALQEQLERAKERIRELEMEVALLKASK